MFEFLRIQYLMGNITKTSLKSLVGIVITDNQYKEIIAK